MSKKEKQLCYLEWKLCRKTYIASREGGGSVPLPQCGPPLYRSFILQQTPPFLFPKYPETATHFVSFAEVPTSTNISNFKMSTKVIKSTGILIYCYLGRMADKFPAIPRVKLRIHKYKRRKQRGSGFDKEQHSFGANC